MSPGARVAVGALLAALGAGCSAAASPDERGPNRKSRLSHLTLEEEPGDQETSKPPLDPPKPNDHRPETKPPVGHATASSGSGRLSRESIEAALGESEQSFGQCTEVYSTFAARVMVTPSGSVSEARVTQSNPDDPAMRDCLTDALRRVRFQSSSGMVPLSFSLAIEPAF
ncbi:MAG: hypothetical protein U0414_05260 [Polyangiaceae bacterium]